MSSLALTIIFAFIIVVLAVGLLGIGWLLTGKSKIQAGSCGRNPHQQRKKECGSDVSCTLCEKPEDKKPPSKD